MKQLGRLLRIAAAVIMLAGAVIGYVMLEGSTFAAVLVLILIVGAAAVLLSGDFGEQFAQKYRSDLEREEDEETDTIMRVITAVPLDENPVELEKADNDSNNEAADSIPKENTEPVKSLTEKEPAVRRQ